MDFLLLSDVLILPLPFLQITNRWSNIWICDTVLSVAHWLSCFWTCWTLSSELSFTLSFVERPNGLGGILVPSISRSMIRNWHRNLSKKLWFCNGPCQLPMSKIHFFYFSLSNDSTYESWSLEPPSSAFSCQPESENILEKIPKMSMTKTKKINKKYIGEHHQFNRICFFF